MIRINLLGQARPKAAKTTVPLEATVQIIFLLVAIGLAVVVLGITYYQQKRQLDETNKRIAALRAEKASLQQIKAEVDRFESEKTVLQQRIDVIETLQRNRSGGQDMLQMVANTVVRVDSLWLTSLDRKGDSLDMEGEAGSINAVANFITELKRSGYFDKVEIKSAKENDLVQSAQTYGFTMTVAIAARSDAVPPTGQAATRGCAAAASATCGQGKELTMATSVPRLALAPAGLFYVGLAVVLVLAGLLRSGSRRSHRAHAARSGAGRSEAARSRTFRACASTSSAARNCNPRWTRCRSSWQRCRRSFLKTSRPISSF